MSSTVPEMAPPAPVVCVRTDSTRSRIRSVADAVFRESSFTSPATTAKPAPAEPARAASIVALRASRLVCSAMPLTPIARSWPSQWCLAANDLAIQVLGGAGYTRDHDVEQHYRDNRLNPIHEGTHGIQALDLLGRKVVADGGAGLKVLLDTFTATSDRATATEDQELGRFAEQLGQAARRVASVTDALWAGGDPELALANATTYLEAVGHVVIAWVWLEQALTAHGKDGAFYQGKRLTTRFFYQWELPRTAPQFDLLASLDRTVLDAPVSCL
jgi:butyryl-CoA dehydrogenase